MRYRQDMGETSRSASTKRRRAVKQGWGVLHPWQLQNCFQLVHIFKKKQQQNTSSLLVTGKPEEPISNSSRILGEGAGAETLKFLPQRLDKVLLIG